MSFRAIVKELLDGAADEIFKLFEKTVAEYEEKLSQCERKDWRRHQRRTGTLQTSPLKKVECEDSAFPRIKEETEVVWSFPLLAPPAKRDGCDDLGRFSTSVETEVSIDEESLSDSGGETKDEDVENNLEDLVFETKACEAKVSCDELEENVDVKKAKQPQTPKKAFVCDVCGRGYSRKANLKEHMGVHTGEKPFLCPHCGKRFRRHYTFRRHVSVHSGKPFGCDFCHKRFSEQSLLQSHVKAHEGEKRLSCDVCNRTFKKASYLKTHLMVHTGEKPFGCGICMRRFKRKGDLKRHMLLHTE